MFIAAVTSFRDPTLDLPLFRITKCSGRWKWRESSSITQAMRCNPSRSSRHHTNWSKKLNHIYQIIIFTKQRLEDCKLSWMCTKVKNKPEYYMCFTSINTLEETIWPEKISISCETPRNVGICSTHVKDLYVCRMSRNFFRGITVPGSWVVNLHITIVGTSHLIRMRMPRKPTSTSEKRFRLSWESLSW